MPIDLLVAFVGFAFVSSITPGPNNLMLMTSGVNFGVRRTLPQIFGINVGFPAMMMMIGLGLGSVFDRFPMLYTVLKVVGILYMLWLAWLIARSGPVQDGAEAGKPIGFWYAAFFQWVNPKSWAMIVGAIAAYTVPSNYFASLVVITVLFVAVGMPCSFAWAIFGSAMRNVLRNPTTVKWFNLVMALLLVASLWPIVAEMR